VAERGAELFHGGWAPLLLLSGHLGSLTSGMWSRSEAEIFAEVATTVGVPRERILVEARSTNTGENVDYSRRRALHPGADERFVAGRREERLPSTKRW